MSHTRATFSTILLSVSIAVVFLLPVYAHAAPSFITPISCFFQSVLFQQSCEVPEEEVSSNEEEQQTSPVTVYNLGTDPQFITLRNAYQDLKEAIFNHEARLNELADAPQNTQTIIREVENRIVEQSVQSNTSFFDMLSVSGNIYTNLDCSQYGSGGKLTTDSNGKLICDNDRKGGGGSSGGGSTNLTVTATGLELSGDAIALASGYTIPLTASTTEWNTLYQTPSTRITAGTGLSWSGNTINLDNDFGASIDESELNIVGSPTNGYVLQASSTAAGGFAWVATSTLGISAGSALTFGTDNQIPYTNAAGDDYDHSANFTFDGSLFSIPGFTFGSGAMSLTAVSTTTIPYNTSNAWVVATSTNGIPLMRFDTTAGNEFVTIGTPGGDVYVGGVGSPSNLIFEEDATISGQGENTLTFGETGDTLIFGTSIRPSVDNSFSLGDSSYHWDCMYYDATSLGTCSSDERLKENIQDFSFGDDALAQFNGLRPRLFSYKDNASGTLNYGFIAQEVLDVAPDLVTLGDDGYYQVKYGYLQYLTIAAVQQFSVDLNEILTTGTTSTSSSFGYLFDSESVWSKLVNIARGFVDGVLTVVGLKTDELCVGEVCVDEETFMKMVETAEEGNKTTSSKTGDSSNNNNTSSTKATSSSSTTDNTNATTTDSTASSTEDTVDDDDGIATSTEEIVSDEDDLSEEVVEDSEDENEDAEDEEISEEDTEEESDVVEEQETTEEPDPAPEHDSATA